MMRRAAASWRRCAAAAVPGATTRSRLVAVRHLRVAIVGRPNVGKSTLFNALRDVRSARERGVRPRADGTGADGVAAPSRQYRLPPAAQLTSPAARTTRDARAAPARLGDLKFDVVDTAGLERRGGTVDVQRGSFVGLGAELRARTGDAVRGADVALLVLDGRSGVTGEDADAVAWLRKAAGDVPRLVVFNKCENDRTVSPDDERAARAFVNLAAAPPIYASAEHGDGLPDVLAALRAFDTEESRLLDAPLAADEVRIALVGRPNVGKSTLANAAARRPVSVAAPEPGVTRDAVDVPLTVGGRAVRLVDTAGVRRLAGAGRRGADVEKNAARATEVEVAARADVAILVIDASQPLLRDDLRLARALKDARTPVVVVANKLDLCGAIATARGVEEFTRDSPLRFLFDAVNAPVVACSALESPARARRALAMAVAAHDANVEKRVPTGPLNAWFRDFRRGPRGDAYAGIRYLAQVGHAPPTFAAFGRSLDKKLGHAKRDQLAAAIARDFDFRGARVDLVLRGGGTDAPRHKSRRDGR